MANHIKLSGEDGRALANRNGGGRPRIFQDDDFFRAATRVVAAGGYRGLTLAAVARELGSSGMAISRRFGSRRGLVRAYLEWALARMATRFDVMRETHCSPIEALRDRGVMPVNQRAEEVGDPADPEHQANWATFWAEMHRDAEFRPLFAAHMRRAEAEAAALLRAGLARGELRPCDPDALARTLTAAWSWTTMYWPGDGPEGTLLERLAEAFEIVVGQLRAT